ncbi:MAG: hypothetical protein ACR2NA_01680 [Solirubrobacterales bacterium]
MSEAHASEVERTLLYVSEARERAGKAVQQLERDQAPAHIVESMRTTERTMADEHRRLLQSTFYAVPADQESLAV